MECLPNIEVLTFLNWIDVSGYARDRIGIPLDELFLNHEHEKQAIALEQEYVYGISANYHSSEAPFERYLDYLLSELKRSVMQEYDKHPYRFDGLFQRFRGDYHSTQSLISCLHYSVEQLGHTMQALNHLRPTSEFKRRTGSLVNSVREYLRYSHDPAVRNFFLETHNSVAGSTLHFLEWVHDHGKLQNINPRNIPADVMERYIHEYVWQEYQRKGLTNKERTEKESVLRRALIQRKYDDYLGSMIRSAHVDCDALDEILHRSSNRPVRFKCTLLAEDESFQVLVRDYWEEMNSYSGNHLDIYYSESELEQKGWATADKLFIREKVSKYPAIFLWEYELGNGVSISVEGLDSHDLMNLFRFIVDEIVKGRGLIEIETAASAAVQSMLNAKCTAKEAENKFTASLLEACAKLQSNESYVRKTDENGRNTYIRDILNESNYFVTDQTLGGLSPTGKSSGEIDLKVHDADKRPFAIIEALNIKADHPCFWNRKYFSDHVNKLYDYDSNGLHRNYLIIYAMVPEFNQFTEAVINQLSSPKCRYGEAGFLDVSPIETRYTDLRMVCARYLRNGKEIRLYVLCVRIARNSTEKTGEKE